MRTNRITSHSEADTAAVGHDLGVRLEAGSVVRLYGELGTGKTVFVRGLAKGLGVQRSEVTSPTFTLVHEHSGGRLRLVHVDLYRLDDPREIEELGLDEIGADGVVAIEWADRWPRSLPGTIDVEIRHGEGNTRTIEITDYSER